MADAAGTSEVLKYVMLSGAEGLPPRPGYPPALVPKASFTLGRIAPNPLGNLLPFG